MRKLGILVAVFAALAGVLVFQRYKQNQLIASEPAEVLSVEPEKVTRLRIEKPGGDKVELAREAGGWKLVAPLEYRANEQVVSGVMQALKALELEDVVSTNPEKRGTYQVDSTGTRVQVLEGDKVVLSLMVGKSTPDFAHTYVRPEDRDQVYRAVGVLTYNFNKRVDDWRDKTVLEVDQESVARVVLEYPKEGLEITLARADSLWTFAVKGGEPTVADSTTAAQVVRSAARIVTVNFATPEETAGLDFAQLDFRLILETDGGSETVEFVEREGNKLYARRPGQATVFQLFKTGLASVMKKPDDFKPKAS